MLINLTNHPSGAWQEKQRVELSKKFGELVDMPFPQISPTATTDELRDVATEYLKKIEDAQPDAVFLAGEFTFAFMMIDELLNRGVPVLISAAGRKTTEEKMKDGTIKKTSKFDFNWYRYYARLRQGLESEYPHLAQPSFERVHGNQTQRLKSAHLARPSNE